MALHHPELSIDIRQYANSLQVGVIYTEWNERIVSSMRSSCLQTLHAAGLEPSQIVEYAVPGSFELPLGAKLLLENQKLDGIICLGCVIKGETSHDEHINRAVSTALMQLGIMSDKPVIFGVLTTNDEAQAIARATGAKGDKGSESAWTMLKMIDLKRRLSGEKKKIGF